MATIYHLDVRCVSAFHAAPVDEVQAAVAGALKRFRFKGTRSPLENVEVAVVGDSGPLDTTPRRARSSRLFRIWCWLWFGHDHEVPGRTVEVCGRCGADIVGGD